MERTKAKGRLTGARAAPRAWSWDEYAAIPQDSFYYEVLWGELVVRPTPSLSHQTFLGALAVGVRTHVRERSLGEVVLGPFAVQLSPCNILEPDLLFVRQARQDVVHEDRAIGAPDLVVEVLSSETAARDRSGKRDAYAAAGVPHYWIADPHYPSIEAYKLEGDSYRLVARVEGDEGLSAEPFPHLSFTPRQLQE